MQTSKASSGQFSIWDQGQGSLLSALAGFTVSSHVLVITFDFSFLLYYLIFSPLRTRGGNPMGGKNSLGWDMAFVWKAFHICLLECLNLEHLILANHLAESLLKMSCTSDVHIIYFLRKWIPWSTCHFPIFDGFAVLLQELFWSLVSIHSAGIHCLESICSAITVQQKYSFFSLRSPRHPSQPLESSTNQRKSMVYF